MNECPLVTVIIPTFKSAKYLRKSIQSIENQSYQRFEMIIVDDTPEDDGTKGIIDSFHDARIQYLKPKERLGMVKSLNYAIQLSKGEFIARMDADDISHKERLKLQIGYLMEHPEVGALGCNCFTIDEKDRVTGCLIHPTENLDIKSKMLFNAAFIHPSVMIRKNIAERYLYSEDCFCCEDYELWSRLIKVTEFHNLSEKLFKYRILSDSAMQSQLKRLKSDSDYYKKHVLILKKVYDNVLSFYGTQGTDLDNQYVDLLFAKKTDLFSSLEKETFLKKCKAVLEKNNQSKYVFRCISYQWIKMTGGKFYKTHDVFLFWGCLKESAYAIFNKVKAIISGKLFINRNEYTWKL